MDACKESIFLYADACWLFAVLVPVPVVLCCVLLLAFLISWNDVVVGLLLFSLADKEGEKWTFVCLPVACK